MPAALTIGAFILGFVIVLAPFALLIQWITRWVAGFKPGFWQAFWALFLGGVLTLAAQGIIVFTGGLSAQPASGVIVLITVIPLMVQSIVSGAMLKDESGCALGFGRAVVVNILNSFVLGLAVVLWLLPAIRDSSKSQPAPVASAMARPKSTPVPGLKPTPMPMVPVRRFATVAEAQREAVRAYPSLGVAGSEFNRDFLARYNRYQRERPGYFSDPSWPWRLAEETARAAAK